MLRQRLRDYNITLQDGDGLDDINPRHKKFIVSQPPHLCLGLVLEAQTYAGVTKCGFDGWILRAVRYLATRFSRARSHFALLSVSIKLVL